MRPEMAFPLVRWLEGTIALRSRLITEEILPILGPHSRADRVMSNVPFLEAIHGRALPLIEAT